MYRFIRLSRFAIISVILTLAFLPSAWGVPVTWTLSGVTFTDGGTATGSFVYDADTDTMSDWSVSVAGGDTNMFPPATYDTNTSTSYFSSYSPIDYGATLSMSGSNRKISLPGTSTLSNAGGVIPINLSGGGASECYNCAPARLYVAGTLIGGDGIFADGFGP